MIKKKDLLKSLLKILEGVSKSFFTYIWNIKILFFLNYPIFNVDPIQSFISNHEKCRDWWSQNVNDHKIRKRLAQFNHYYTMSNAVNYPQNLGKQMHFNLVLSPTLRKAAGRLRHGSLLCDWTAQTVNQIPLTICVVSPFPHPYCDKFCLLHYDWLRARTGFYGWPILEQDSVSHKPIKGNEAGRGGIRVWKE